MITLITVKNPFKTDREIKQISYTPGQTLLGYAAPETMGFEEEEFVVTHNGEIVEPEKYNQIIPGPEDYIAVCPVISGGDDVGKDIARAVALIAVTIVSMGVGNLVAYGTWAGTAAGWGWGSYVAAAATAYAGGQLVNHLFPPPKQDGRTDIPTWSNQPPITKEGGGIPITFGTVKMGVMAPIQVLNQKVTNSGTKSYLNLLLCGGEEVDEIKDIKINNQPISNYPDVKVYTRLGTNDQTVIPGFADTWEEVSVGTELTEEGGWVYGQTRSDQGSGLELTFAFPLGLYYRKDNGKLLAEWVRIQAQYRKVGETDWQTWMSNTSLMSLPVSSVSGNSFSVFTGFSASAALRKGLCIKLIHDNGTTNAEIVSAVYNQDDGTTRITVDAAVPLTTTKMEMRYIEIDRKNNSPFSFVTRADNIGAGQYEVRCKIIKEGTGEKRTNTTVWTTLTHIIYDDFIRPGKSLVGIQALATDRLSGSLNVTWIQSRHNVWIWSPITCQYEQRPANNPAWAAYDVLYRIKRLKNINTGQYEFVVFSDVEPEYMDYQSFTDWAASCTNRNLQFNGVIYETNDIWEALAPIEMAGRGKVIIRGTRYSVIHDVPASSTGMYTVSNILKDSFKIEYIGKKDRANALEITFFNSDNDFEETTVLCYGPNYDEASAVTKPTQLRLPYAMSLEQAFKEGKYQLRLNYYLNRAIYWKAGIDSLTGRAGEVVYVQHDVPEWGIGGRVAYVVDNDVFLDKEVTMEPGQNYGLLIRLADDTLIEKALVPVTETTTAHYVTVAEPFDSDKVPDTDDVFSFGLYQREAMPVRLVTVKRSGKLSAEMMGLEYIPEIYEEATDIPEIDYTLPAGQLANIIVDQYQDYLGDALVGMSWTWTGARALNEVRVFVNNEQVGLVQGHETTFSYNVDHIPEGTQVAIRLEALDGFGNPIDTATVLWTIEAKATAPKDVVWGECSFVDKVVLRWNAVTNYDLQAYEVRIDENFGSDDVNLVYRGDELSYVIERPTQRQYTFYVKALNRAGTYSENIASKTLENAIPSTPPLPAITEFFSSLWIEIRPVPDNDILGYNLYMTPCDEQGNPAGGTQVTTYPTPQRITYQASVKSSFLVQVAAFDVLGEGEKCAPVLARTRTIDEVAAFAQNIAFPKIVDELPKLPSDEYPADSLVVLSTDHQLYRSTGTEWDNSVSTEQLVGKITAGMIAAGAIGAAEIATQSLIADHFAAGSIEAYVAAVQEAFIDSAKIINLDASKITVGSSSAPIPLAVQPGDTLFRFDGSLLSTQGEKPLGME